MYIEYTIFEFIIFFYSTKMSKVTKAKTNVKTNVVTKTGTKAVAKKGAKKTGAKKDVMRTYVSQRGYVVMKDELGETEVARLRKDLTVKPFVNTDYGPEPEAFEVFLENDRKMYIPKFYGRGRYGNETDGNKIGAGVKINVKFGGSLRDNQKEPAEACMTAFADPLRGGGILNLPCGYGKTALACYLIATLGKKTIVVVHKEFLVKQWIERITQFVPDARIGIIQRNKVEIEDKDIVIAMLQSVSMKDYDLSVFSSFGLTVIDECHTVPCKVFSQCLRKINTPCMLGLSATPQRKDGLLKVLKWYIGDIVYAVARRKIVGNIVVERNIIESDDYVYSREVLNFKGKPQIGTMITNIVQFKKRTLMMCQRVMDVLKEDERRKVLVLSERRDHLAEMKTILDAFDINSGYYVGGMKEKDLKASESCDVIFGTYAMASTGMDIPGLNCLFMVSPRSDIKQSVGRIIRKEKLDLDGLIVDYVDNFSCFKRQASTRQNFYFKEGYEIRTFLVDDSGKVLAQMETIKKNVCDKEVVGKVAGGKKYVSKSKLGVHEGTKSPIVGGKYGVKPKGTGGLFSG